MQVIQINTASGTPPYDIYVCDETITYCYFVLTGVSVFPVYIDLPPFLTGVRNVIVKLIDSNGCELFYNIPCMLPTPSVTVTPSYTPTPTPTPTTFGDNCRCIQFSNNSEDPIDYQYINCSGIFVNDSAPPNQIICRCGSNPSTSNEKLTITILGGCNLTCLGGVCP